MKGSSDEEDEERKGEESSDMLSASEFSCLNGTSLEALTVLPETKGLVDGLSRFFMPSNKRSSRVSLSTNPMALVGSLSPETEDEPPTLKKIENVKKVALKNTSRKIQKAASKLIKRSKIKFVQAVKRKKKKGTGPPLSNQLRGLFDGLSEFFNATGERKRSFPTYNPALKRRNENIYQSVDSSDSDSFEIPHKINSDRKCSGVDSNSHVSNHGDNYICDKKSGHSLNVCINDGLGASGGKLRSDIFSSSSSRRVEISWWNEMNRLMHMTLDEFRRYGLKPIHPSRCTHHRGRGAFSHCGRGGYWPRRNRTLIPRMIYRGKILSPFSSITSIYSQ